MAANWRSGNKREAAVAFSHISHSGEENAKAVHSTMKVLKKIDPAGTLEAQLACLRQMYADWVDSEPAEPESDRPSEDEMEAFEHAEKEHAEAVSFQRYVLIVRCVSEKKAKTPPDI